MKKKFKILIDYDDVLFPLIPSWVKSINTTYGTNIHPNEITEWDITKFFPTLTREEIFSPIYDDEFWNRLEPVLGGPKSLFNLINNGHRVKIVTSTFYQNVKPKMERLFECYPFLKWEDVIVTAEKQEIIGDILIDDRAENLIDGKYQKILVNKPHNRWCNTVSNNIVRVNDVVEACRHINMMVEQKCAYYDHADTWQYCLKCKNCYDDNGGLYCNIGGNGKFEVIQ